MANEYEYKEFAIIISSVCLGCMQSWLWSKKRVDVVIMAKVLDCKCRL